MGRSDKDATMKTLTGVSPVESWEGQDAADTRLRQGYVGQAAATTEEGAEHL